MCAKKVAIDESSIEFEFQVNGRHIIRMVTVVASVYVPLLVIEPP